jgi:hypothetical protein
MLRVIRVERGGRVPLQFWRAILGWASEPGHRPAAPRLGAAFEPLDDRSGITGAMEFPRLYAPPEASAATRSADVSAADEAEVVGLFLAQCGAVAALDAALTATADYFRDRGGGSNDGFVRALYRDLLGRDPDAGAGGLVADLDAGRTTSADVAAAFVARPDYQLQLTAAYFRDYLGRPLDAAGLDRAAGLLGGHIDAAARRAA